MSYNSFMMRFLSSRTDKKRDKNLKVPEHVEAFYDIPYAKGGTYNLLDIYYPKGTKESLPVIVSIHGGGYVYGTKEVYQYYGMSLVQQGFVFVNFNYHLAPKYKFPTQLMEINQVMEWIGNNHNTYYMDIDNVFVVGDSAGAQLASHYCTIYSNPKFMAEFSFRVPEEVKIRAVALNCGMYDIPTGKEYEEKEENKFFNDYLGKDRTQIKDMLQVKAHITKQFPPAYIMSSYYDFLKERAKSMYDLLREKGVQAEYKIYGEKGQKYMGHVFHCNMNLKEAEICNREECDFFRKYIV